jgi:hypothetical protein
MGRLWREANIKAWAPSHFCRPIFQQRRRKRNPILANTVIAEERLIEHVFGRYADGARSAICACWQAGACLPGSNGNTLVLPDRLIGPSPKSYAWTVPKTITSQQEIAMRIEDRLDRMLDLALELTFPASDPISVYIPEIGIADEKAVDREETLETLPLAA